MFPMNYIKHLNGFFEESGDDKNLSAYHISLYMSLFQLWNLNRFQNPFPVDREELMQLSRIGSKNTYARCMKELHQWGYINYSPSGNFHTGRKVSCTRFDTRTGTRYETRTGIRSGTVLKNTNNTNGDKQGTPKIFENGRGKKVNRKSPHYVETDKDYSEPL